MRTNGKEIFVAVLLGFVLPSVIFSQLTKGEKKPREETGTRPTQIATEEATEPSPQMISVIMDDGSVTEMELESYITGVVLQEMPTEFEEEALKAQAVVARTYALRRQKTANKHTDAAVCTDAGCCQGFCGEEDYSDKGIGQEDYEKVKLAVTQTSGQVLVYEGELIEATYFSCSGGMTEDAKAVWGADVPYLQATESPGEEKATHYSDTVRFTTMEFQNALGEVLTGAPETWFQSPEYTQGGGVATIQIGGKEYTGVRLRELLGLRSTAFIITAVGDTVSVTTKGYGHRVGMSQYGADAMAVNGSDYRQILAHYYSGTELVDSVQ